MWPELELQTQRIPCMKCWWSGSKKMGQGASVNMLLAALDTLGERNAKENIQEHLLDSGKYVYEDGASSAVL